jgi:hypothetical protein
MDPIPVRSNGGFRVQGAVVDESGVINHYVIVGRIHGNVASGTLDSYRYNSVGNIGDSAVVKCARHLHWRSVRSSSSAGSGPVAFFDVLPFRFGRPGAWAYYLVTKVHACYGANFARVGIVGGPSQTIPCNGQVRLGPLTPQRTYAVVVTALLIRHGRTSHTASAPPLSVYLPGEDGNWILLN